MADRASADFMISSVLMTGEYERLVIDYEPYRERQVQALVADKVEELEDDAAPPPIMGGLSSGEDAVAWRFPES